MQRSFRERHFEVTGLGAQQLEQAVQHRTKVAAIPLHPIYLRPVDA
jgi:hypothetical protein